MMPQRKSSALSSLVLQDGDNNFEVHVIPSIWRRKVDSEGGVTASKGELLTQKHSPQDKHGMEQSEE